VSRPRSETSWTRFPSLDIHESLLVRTGDLLRHSSYLLTRFLEEYSYLDPSPTSNLGSAKMGKGHKSTKVCILPIYHLSTIAPPNLTSLRSSSPLLPVRIVLDIPQVPGVKLRPAPKPKRQTSDPSSSAHPQSLSDTEGPNPDAEVSHTHDLFTEKPFLGVVLALSGFIDKVCLLPM
jgi:hypothetical protein